MNGFSNDLILIHKTACLCWAFPSRKFLTLQILKTHSFTFCFSFITPSSLDCCAYLRVCVYTCEPYLILYPVVYLCTHMYTHRNHWQIFLFLQGYSYRHSSSCIIQYKTILVIIIKPSDAFFALLLFFIKNYKVTNFIVMCNFIHNFLVTGNALTCFCISY